MTRVTRLMLVLALVSAFVVAGCKKDEVVATDTGAATETGTTMATDTAATVATETTATTATTVAAAESTGVAECDSYLAALDKYMKCDKVPQAARDAQQASAQQMRTSWASWASLPADARTAAQNAAKTSCTTALNSLKQAGTAIGCPVE